MNPMPVSVGDHKYIYFTTKLANGLLLSIIGPVASMQQSLGQKIGDLTCVCEHKKIAQLYLVQQTSVLNTLLSSWDKL
jgi:hypothetical protein